MGTGGVFMGNRRYDPDFKREAVRLAVEEGIATKAGRRMVLAVLSKNFALLESNRGKIASGG
jgi:hypothetical protein